MESRLLRPAAIAMLAVVVVYFALVGAGPLIHDWRVYAAIDFAFYFCIGLFAARHLAEWRGAVLVVASAALLDSVLGIVALILPNAPPVAPSDVALPVLKEFVVNVVVGTLGALVGARTRRA